MFWLYISNCITFIFFSTYLIILKYFVGIFINHNLYGFTDKCFLILNSSYKILSFFYCFNIMCISIHIFLFLFSINVMWFSYIYKHGSVCLMLICLLCTILLCIYCCILNESSELILLNKFKYSTDLTVAFSLLIYHLTYEHL